MDWVHSLSYMTLQQLQQHSRKPCSSLSSKRCHASIADMQHSSTM